MAATTIPNRSRSPYLHDRGQDFPWMSTSRGEKQIETRTGAIVTHISVVRPIVVARTRHSGLTSSFDRNWTSSCMNVESDSSSGSSSCSSTTRGRRRFRKRVTQPHRPSHIPRQHTVIVLGVYEVLIGSENAESNLNDDWSISSVSCDDR